MAETKNISEIASSISDELFRLFLWKTHPKRDDNFKCVNANHASKTGVSKATHPGDVVFYYEDPYLRKRIYLHTDLKSYSETSIVASRLRDAFESLCMTVECANESGKWREKYSADDTVAHEVRGLLFVHNHAGTGDKAFKDAIAKVRFQSLPISLGTVVHFLGPGDIQRLWSIGNDIIRLSHQGKIGDDYSFYYPDLMLHRRHGDGSGQAATIESLTGPYFILKHGIAKNSKQGYVIYINRPDADPAALEYFLDSLSRYQMLEAGECIRVRVTGTGAEIEDIKSRFETAKQRYARAWGFEPTRVRILDAIEIAPVTSVTQNFNPGVIGWRE